MSNDSSIPTNPSSPSPHLGPAWSCPQCFQQNPPSTDAFIRCVHCSWSPTKHDRKATPFDVHIFKIWLLFFLPARIPLAMIYLSPPTGHVEVAVRFLMAAGFALVSLISLGLWNAIRKAPFKLTVPMFAVEFLSLFVILPTLLWHFASRPIFDFFGWL